MLDSAKRSKPAPNRLRQVSLGPRGVGQSGAQDLARFFFHRAPVVGGARPQVGVGFLVQLPNWECGHASNDSIASIGCKEALEQFVRVFVRIGGGRGGAKGASFCAAGSPQQAPSFYVLSIVVRRAGSTQVLAFFRVEGCLRETC